MYFTFSTILHDVLFENVNLKSAVGFTGFCIVIAVSILIYEILKGLMLYVIYQDEVNRSSSHRSESSCHLLATNPQPLRQSRVFLDLAAVVLHFSSSFLGYTIMLVVMTFNFWFLLIVAASSVAFHLFTGYFLMDLKMKTNKLRKYNQEALANTRQSSEEASVSATIDDNLSVDGTSPVAFHSRSNVDMNESVRM